MPLHFLRAAARRCRKKVKLVEVEEGREEKEDRLASHNLGVEGILVPPSIIPEPGRRKLDSS